MSSFTPDIGPWVAYTPVVTATTGTITTYSASGAYKQIGKMVFFRMFITMTNAGTASGGNDITLPVTAVSTRQSATGTENAVTGKGLTCPFVTTTTLRVHFYDATFAGATGSIFQISGVYEAA